MGKTDGSESLVCGRCGARFECGARAVSENCWCAAFPPVMPMPAASATCMCPACLRTEIDRRQAGASA